LTRLFQSVKKSASPAASSCAPLLCRPLTGPGVHEGSSYHLIPEFRGARAQWNFTDHLATSTVSKRFQGSPSSTLYKADPPPAKLWVKSSRVGEVIIKEHIGQHHDQRHSLSFLPCVIENVSVCDMCHLYNLYFTCYRHFNQALLLRDKWNVHRYAARCERNISVVNHSRNIHSVYTVSFLLYISSLLYLIVYICHLYCLIETTDYISQFTDSNVDISPFTRDNYIHGHHSFTNHFMSSLRVCAINKTSLEHWHPLLF